jgi:polysaccharide pyruvyl transferase WcaK-like protein
MRFAVTGVTVSGNMGGAAMLAAAVDEMSRRFPGASFSLLSISPARDRQRNRDRRVVVVDARPIPLLLLYLPLAVLAWPARGLAMVRRSLAAIPYFRSLLDADAVIDLSGIAFVDDRGLPLLAYNVACCLPALVMGRPVVKLAQALGPFRTQPNRLLARLVLSRCRVVIARGEESLGHLEDLGIEGAECLPDTSFAMSLTDTHVEAARRLLPARAEGKRLLVASPSEVVRRLCRKKGIDFEEEFCAFAHLRLEEGWELVLIPHSFGTGSSKNNDLDLCRRILNRLPGSHGHMIEPVEDARILRAAIGLADAFVGCRFHSVVAALSMGVPALVVGWSHKYREMTEMLQPGAWSLDASEVSAQSLDNAFRRLEAQLEAQRGEIARRLPQVRERARRNFDLAAAAAA